MEDTARVILNKLKLVDPTTTTSTFSSAYQQSAEIQQLWISVGSSIYTILTITSATFSTNPLDASSQLISVLSASTLLSSIIHAIITTQRRLNKSDENIEIIIKKEMQVILYHIQILKQDLNQSTIKTKSAQEAIINHTDILVDSLVAFSLSPSNNNMQLQLHPYKVSPSSSFQRRHSQPNTVIRKNSSDEFITKTLSHHQYDSNNSLNSNNSRDKTDTVGKKFMRSIHSLKSRPAFQMTLLPSRHSIEPSTGHPPKKKRTFYDHRASAIISELEEDPDNSDDNSICWDDDSSSNNSTAIKTKPSTLTFILNSSNKRQQQASKRSSTRGIKDLFQFTPKDESKKKRESLSNLFSSNIKNKQLITKDVENMMQGSICSSSASTSTSSAESTKKQVIMKINDNVEINRPYLVSPSAKKTNILWSMEEHTNNSKQLSNSNHHMDQEECYDSNIISSSSFESYTIIESKQQDNYHELNSMQKEKSRKRRSNGSLVAPSLSPPKILSSTPMTRNNSPLPPLPTVENFLTIMNTPTSPDSSYFSARSTSSSSSSQSTLNSMILDDVTDNLAKTHISSAEDRFLQNSDNEMKKSEENEYMQVDSCPPIPPPKDPLSTADRIDIQRKLMDPQDHIISNMNNKQEKRSSAISLKRSSAVSTEMRISTSDISNHAKFSPPKSADANISKKRPPIPPRTSSMPLPPTPPKNAATTIPPLPVDAKKKTSAYSRRSSTKTLEENTTWSTLLENTNNKKDELIKRAKLGRSLGTATNPSKKLKKSDSGGKLLKVTENGSVVLLFETIDGRLQAIAGTKEKLFERLADETAQDEEYIDTYLMNHAHFISSLDFLNLLINRFHLEPSPGEYEYFKKWQFSIQTKVLNVVEHWILCYYQDFKLDVNLQKRLNLFLYNDSLLLGPQFKQQLAKIRFSLKSQATQFSDGQHHIILHSANTAPNQQNNNSNFNFHFPFVNSNHTPPFPPAHLSNNPRRPSNGLFNLTSLSTPPDSPTVVYSNNAPGLYTSFTSLESKDIARYLTLADYYLFKSIQAHGLLNSGKKSKSEVEYDYVELMTKRANMLSHWVVHEICSISYLKPKRALLKKFIEIAKLCLELNNFHTCMVITMGLSSAPKLKETWESLSNRDMNTFESLQKLLDVSLNMRYYRQKIQLAKSPSVPFLPVVLKDQTFFKENSTFSVNYPNLINFSKFRSIRQFIEKTKILTNEPYWYANDLTRYPFFPATGTTTTTHSGQLDSIGDWLENRLSKVQDCYLHCDLLNI